VGRFVSSAWVFDFPWTGGAALALAASCAAAVGVNVSQFACLGRFSAVSFQVLGHAKTVAVLVGGWAFLGDDISTKQALGMALAVAGMVGYGVASSAAAAPVPGGAGGLRGKASAADDADIATVAKASGGRAPGGAGGTSPYRIKATV